MHEAPSSRATTTYQGIVQNHTTLGFLLPNIPFYFIVSKTTKRPYKCQRYYKVFLRLEVFVHLGLRWIEPLPLLTNPVIILPPLLIPFFVGG